ncbi:MAG: GtrA family protein [Candidatus Taylorbacteria bacterium]|nr:GtrA family protein [Candidatus Taylorbacteria bacterium]
MIFSRKDLTYSIITGFITGLIAWRVFDFLEAPSFGLPSHALLVVIVPVLWILGVNLGYFLGRWMPFFNQFGKFAAVGFTNAAVDFGVLNLLIGRSGIESGIYYSVFKSISFVVAVVHSYVWNKYWVFEAGSSGGGRPEAIKFFSVNIVAIVFNVGVASLVVNYVEPWGGLDAKVWANIGAVVGAACAIFLTFIGARLLVFKKSSNEILNPKS